MAPPDHPLLNSMRFHMFSVGCNDENMVRSLQRYFTIKYFTLIEQWGPLKSLQSYKWYIGIGRFRILGGQGLAFCGGGANSQQAHDVVTTSMRRNDVASTSFRRRVPTRFLINQCQIITFLILEYDIIENSRIELRGIILPVQVGGLLGGGGGGGAKGYVDPPPLSNYWEGLAPLAPPPPLFLRLCGKNI